eukprot:m.35346 g.35346  ORF g.35346 m.35346 type:complete len:345 (-) comp12386_c0_seq1:126-1160(-)
MADDECAICMCEKATIALPCHHHACKDCATAAFKEDIEKGKVPVECFECKEEVPLDTILDVLKDHPTLVDKIHRFGLSRALQRDPNVRFCPQANCNYAVILSRAVGKKRLVKCDCCHESFCIKCREPAHQGTCSFHDEENTKPCPKCNSPIYKEDDASCNAVYCTICQTEFCWLCGAVLGLHGMNHFFGLQGCTMYGKQRWSMDRVRRHRRWSPVAYPAAVAAAAVATPLLYLGLPVAMGMEENRNCKTSGIKRGKRIARVAGISTATAVFMAPAMAIGLAALVVRGAVFSYVQVPAEEAAGLVKRSARRRRARRNAVQALNETDPEPVDANVAVAEITAESTA